MCGGVCTQDIGLTALYVYDIGFVGFTVVFVGFTGFAEFTLAGPGSGSQWYGGTIAANWCNAAAANYFPAANYFKFQPPLSFF
jgi:hypothetical protein